MGAGSLGRCFPLQVLLPCFRSRQAAHFCHSMTEDNLPFPSPGKHSRCRESRVLGWLTQGAPAKEQWCAYSSRSWRIGHPSMDLALGDNSRDHSSLGETTRCGDPVLSTHPVLREFLLFPTVVPHVSCWWPHPTSQHPDTDSYPIYTPAPDSPLNPPGSHV